MTAAVMAPRAVVSAAVSFAVFMVVALGIGIICKCAGNKSLHCAIGISLNASKEPNTGLFQRHPRSAADAAAEQYIDL